MEMKQTQEMAFQPRKPKKAWKPKKAIQDMDWKPKNRKRAKEVVKYGNASRPSRFERLEVRVPILFSTSILVGEPSPQNVGEKGT